MKTLFTRPALMLAVSLLVVSPLVSSADATPAGTDNAVAASKPTTVMASSEQLAQSLPTDMQAPAADQPRAETGRKHSNGTHPAELSYKRPVYPVGVPNPPVSLESY